MVASSIRNLPDEILEKILERLPLSDYVRFGGVCTGWRDLQGRHNSACSPSPPPMISLPWFFPDNSLDDPIITFRSPFERRRDEQIPTSYHLHNPYLLLPHLGEEKHSMLGQFCLGPYGNCGGWLVLGDLHSQVFLINPISGSIITLPSLKICYDGCYAALTPPPHYAVFLISMEYNAEQIQLSFVRYGDQEWSEMAIPTELVPRSLISFGGDLYLAGLDHWDIHVVRTRCSGDAPCMVTFTMDRSKPLSDCRPDRKFLVESEGKVLLVLQIENVFRVFQADLSARMWVRKESIGNRILIIDIFTACSLPASGISHRFRGNCIYISPARSGGTQWKIFDMSTGKLTYHSDFLGPSPLHGRMFLPSLR